MKTEYPNNSYQFSAQGVMEAASGLSAKYEELRRARLIQEGGSHYKEMSIQPWDVVDTWPLEQQIGFYRGNALKYIMRMGTKDEQIGEAKKARHYIEKLIEVLGGSNGNQT